MRGVHFGTGAQKAPHAIIKSIRQSRLLSITFNYNVRDYQKKKINR